jgi:hypothetical protein
MYHRTCQLQFTICIFDVCLSMHHNIMPWLLVVGCCKQGGRQCIWDEGEETLHTVCCNNTSIVSSFWWWAYTFPKHVEQIISAIKHSVASSWFSSLCLYNLYITTQLLVDGHPPNIINNNTEIKGQLEVESVTTSRYMCTYVNISES